YRDYPFNYERSVPVSTDPRDVFPLGSFLIDLRDPFEETHRRAIGPQTHSHLRFGESRLNEIPGPGGFVPYLGKEFNGFLQIDGIRNSTSFDIGKVARARDGGRIDGQDETFNACAFYTFDNGCRRVASADIIKLIEYRTAGVFHDLFNRRSGYTANKLNGPRFACRPCNTSFTIRMSDGEKSY